MSIELPPGVEREQPAQPRYSKMTISLDEATGQISLSHPNSEQICDLFLKRAASALLPQFVETSCEAGIVLTITYDSQNTDAVESFSFEFASPRHTPNQLQKEMFLDGLLKKVRQRLDIFWMQQQQHAAQQGVTLATEAMLGGMRAPNGKKR